MFSNDSFYANLSSPFYKPPTDFSPKQTICDACTLTYCTWIKLCQYDRCTEELLLTSTQIGAQTGREAGMCGSIMPKHSQQSDQQRDVQGLCSNLLIRIKALEMYHLVFGGGVCLQNKRQTTYIKLIKILQPLGGRKGQ